MNESDFHDLISSRQQGIGPSLMRGGLALLSVGYRLGVKIRNLAFDLGLKYVFQASAPVISVGNITTGGTGKTPFVAFIANWFTQQNMQVVLISRGYHALPGEVNDEKLVLDQLCANIPHLQNPNRVASAKTACEKYEADILLLDDGFQHRKLHRNLNIVLIDALNPFGYGKLLPRGLLREPITALNRADLVVITRADQANEEALDQIVSQIEATRKSKDHLQVCFPPTELKNTQQQSHSLTELKNQKVAACCGIGNPESFRNLLLRLGCEIVLFHPFPDHHHFTQAELEHFAQQAAELGASQIITTQKDLVKLKQTHYAGLPLWAVIIGTQILAGEKLLLDQLAQIVPQKT